MRPLNLLYDLFLKNNILIQKYNLITLTDHVS
jgi:hypothetical protein